MNFRPISMVLVAAGCVLSSSLANATLWATNSGSANVTCDQATLLVAPANSTCWGNTYNSSPGGGAPTLTVNAWANTVGSANTAIENAYLGVYGANGLGVTNRDLTTAGGDSGEGSTPEHAMDNDQRFDSLLFKFSGKVILDTVSVGWSATDSDLTVLAYTGPLATAPLSGLAYTALVANGWSIVGSYANVGSGGASINSGGISSSYWLIAAYNNTIQDAGFVPTNNDYVKIASVNGTADTTIPPGLAPEPYTPALVAAGLFALMASRTRVMRRAKV